MWESLVSSCPGWGCGPSCQQAHHLHLREEAHHTDLGALGLDFCEVSSVSSWGKKHRRLVTDWREPE